MQFIWFEQYKNQIALSTAVSTFEFACVNSCLNETVYP